MPGPPPPGGEAGLSATGELIAQRVLAAATGGRDGVLHLIGDPGGLVYLGGGRVLLVQTRAAPGIDLLVLHRSRPREERPRLLAAMTTSEGRDTAAAQAREVLASGAIPPPDLEILQQQAVADAAAALLAVDGTALVRSRFFRGERPWTRLSDPLTVDDLVAEAARRRRLLERVAAGRVTPDTRPVRAPDLPVQAVRLSALQWELVTLSDGRRTVRDLAWILGRGVVATTLDVARLHRHGLLAAGGGIARGDVARGGGPELPRGRRTEAEVVHGRAHR